MTYEEKKKKKPSSMYRIAIPRGFRDIRVVALLR